jgi:hypothetical protein
MKNVEADICMYFGFKTEARRLVRHKREDTIKITVKEMQCGNLD